MTEALDAVLVLYHHFPAENAPTILDHALSLERHSRFPVVSLNTDDGYAPALDDLDVAVVVLHYSLFPTARYFLDRGWLRFLERTKAAKVAFFQDDYRYCQQRFELIDHFHIDTVYTLLPEQFLDQVYGRHTNARTIRSTLAGYVSDGLVAASEQLAIPDAERPIDVGYRARRVPFSLGRAGQEKHEIADRFVEHVAGRGLRTDIATGADTRIYGEAWYRFVASCRAMLGVEAGVSVFDFDDSATRRTEQLLAKSPRLSFAEVERQVLHEYEGNIAYRVVSPRHFEAAAFRVVQILFEGHYSGVLLPDVHYLPLAKDFSNFDDVMARFADPELRRTMTERAHLDLVASGRYSYAGFVAELDEHFTALGLRDGGLDASQVRDLTARLQRGRALRRVATRVRSLRTRSFPGRRLAAAAYRAVLRRPGGTR